MKTETHTLEHEQFLKQFAANQQRLFAFVVSLAPSWVDADDIFQSVSLVLWRKWRNYDPDRSFLDWAMGVARIEVRKHMAMQGRSDRMLSEEAMMMIESEIEQANDSIDPRLHALETCLDKLPRKHRSLLNQCYASRVKIKEVAVSHGLSCSALYGRLKRIREILHKCIDRSVVAAQEDICSG